MNAILKNSHVLVVDDEVINQTIMEISLQEKDCKVTCFSSGNACLAALEEQSLRRYDCLITDYSMPGMSGTELLEQIKQRDPTLEVIIVTGENERKIIQESLRRGAFDFLDKPLNLDKLYQAVGSAIRATAQRRQKEATEASLLAARSTGLFNAIENPTWRASVSLIYAPKHQLGGDFLEVFETPSGQKCAVIGDISGHDIQSALLSSHFLGSLYGRRTGGEFFESKAFLSDYNELLVHRREGQKSAGNLSVGSSLAICTMELDPDEGTVQIINAGNPPVYFIHKDGTVERVESPHHPLGWFEGMDLVATTHSTRNIHSILSFTDGLVDLASKHQMDVLCLVHYLQTINHSEQQEFLCTAMDDILLAGIQFDPAPLTAIPLVYERYRGTEGNKIDRYQQTWKNSIMRHLPDISKTKCDRFLLACREAVINGIKHGCSGSHHQFAEFQITYHTEKQRIEGWVIDSGAGHAFDYQERDDRLVDMKPGNLGLLLISKLVDKIHVKNGGTQLHFEMNLA
jgi:FixJ family two-component response regulator/anti-sigma regulatory factor (Ser/Thr protein kinase)